MEDKTSTENNTDSVTIEDKTPIDDKTVTVTIEDKKPIVDNTVTVTIEDKKPIEDNTVTVTIEDKKPIVDNTVTVTIEDKKPIDDNTVAIVDKTPIENTTVKFEETPTSNNTNGQTGGASEDATPIQSSPKDGSQGWRSFLALFCCAKGQADINGTTSPTTNSAQYSKKTKKKSNKNADDESNINDLNASVDDLFGKQWFGYSRKKSKKAKNMTNLDVIGEVKTVDNDILKAKLGAKPKGKRPPTSLHMKRMVSSDVFENLSPILSPNLPLISELSLTGTALPEVDNKDETDATQKSISEQQTAKPSQPSEKKEEEANKNEEESEEMKKKNSTNEETERKRIESKTDGSSKETVNVPATPKVTDSTSFEVTAATSPKAKDVTLTDAKDTKSPHAIATTTSPEVKAPLSPEVKAPISPEVKAPISPEVKAPISPEVKAPISPEVKAPLSPEVKAPLSPEVKAPLSPEVKAPISPEVKAPISPEVKATISPEVKAPISPEVKATISSEVRVTSASPEIKVSTTPTDVKLSPDVASANADKKTSHDEQLEVKRTQQTQSNNNSLVNDRKSLSPTVNLSPTQAPQEPDKNHSKVTSEEKSSVGNVEKSDEGHIERATVEKVKVEESQSTEKKAEKHEVAVEKPKKARPDVGKKPSVSSCKTPSISREMSTDSVDLSGKTDDATTKVETEVFVQKEGDSKEKTTLEEKKSDVGHDLELAKISQKTEDKDSSTQNKDTVSS